MNKIKYIKIALLALLPVAVLTSCRKTFLDVDPQGQLTEVQALTDPNAANLLVGGVYNSLYLGGFGSNTVGFLWVCANDMASDNADKGSTPGDFAPAGEIDNFTHTPNNFVFNNIWSGHYQGIARANKAIDILNKSSFDTATRNRLLAESRFLRGLYYFNLVRFFGGVPKIIRVPADPQEGNSDEFQTRASVADIYAQILSDLEFAEALLPMKGDPETQIGRATKGAAQSYLSKVHLYLENWQDAFDYSNAVIQSGKYSLVQTADYHVIFREKPVGGVGGVNNSESIFEVQTGVNSAENAVSPLYSNGQGPRGKGGWNDLGFGLNTPTADLANAYEAGDTRRAGTIIFINPTVPGNSTGTVLWDGYRIPSQDSVENPRYNYKAYHSPLAESPQTTNSKDNKPKNIRLMRYAEVLLIYAEAANRLSNMTEASAKMNMVRNRANLPDSLGTLQNIWEERRLELAMEQDRFLDLVRTGQAETVLTAHGKAFAAGKNEVFPIPQQQIDLSGGRLTQNLGY
jgi:starch-binding outer membrane protein, SusD/RagB family